MHIPSLAAAILAAIIAIGIPLTGPFERAMYRSDPKNPRKFTAYAANIILLWGLLAAAIGIDGLTPLLGSPAPSSAWLWAPAIVRPVLYLLVASYMIAGLLPLIQSLRGDRWRQAYAAATRRNFKDIPELLPDTAAERAAWILLSFSAGICEEIACRSFMIRFLHETITGMPLVGALAASSLIFGLAHTYQGVKGVLGTAVGGFALGLLFLLSGSLIPSIVLHVLLDLQVAYILRPVQTPRLNR
jgi:membrane protease YdiL (CAAX protease family)